MIYKNHKQYRLPYFNYASSNLYFVTICTHHRERLFGKIESGKMILSEEGNLVNESWNIIPSVTDYADTDCFVIMPDHIHGIILINNPGQPKALENMEFVVQKRSLSNVVRNFKSAVTTKIRKYRSNPALNIWQPRFYDRILRNEKEITTVRNYIINNPKRWNDKDRDPGNMLTPM